MNPVIDTDGHVFETNYVYSVAEPDGTTLGSMFPSLYFAQLTGRKEVRFDWAKFTWIGAPEHNGSVFYMRSDTQYKSLEDVRNAGEPPKCSTTAVDTASYYVPKLIEETLKLRLNLVTGYPGGAEQDLALERGDVQCRAGPWPSPLFSAVYLAQERFRSFVSTDPASAGSEVT